MSDMAPTVRFLVGDVFDRMAELDDGSIDLILTSPPFLALRSYLPADHPDKAKEIGSESTPAEFIDTLLRLTAEWRRLLAPHGSLVVELGDTYSGSGGAGGDYNPGGWREGQEAFRGSAFRHIDAKYERIQDDVKYKGSIRNLHGKKQAGGPGWPLPKSLALVPEAYRFALAYGINPHTGQPSPAGRWRIRNVIRWVRPNPPVGALGDKFRPATSDMVVACTSDKRFFDLDAVRQQPSTNTHRRVAKGAGKRPNTMPSGQRDGNWDSLPISDEAHPAGAPPLDWWNIPPKGYSGAHYAVWPPDLLIRPVKAMCPERVCTVCGQPSRRITEVDYMKLQTTSNPTRRGSVLGVNAPGSDPTYIHGRAAKSVETVGWTDCGHNSWRPGVVLDPFAGTGTTLMVAHGHGRSAIGVDLDERNAILAQQRIGPMFLTVEQ